MNWTQKALGAAAALVFLSLPAYSQTIGRDELIVSFIHQANRHEIEMATLANQNSSSQNVKDFADRMIGDHQAAEDLVRAYATSHNIDLDTLHRRVQQVGQEDLENERRAKALGTASGEWAWTWEQAVRSRNDHQAVMNKLRDLKGSEFDRAFIRAMVEDHQRVIARLTAGRTQVRDSELTSLIDKLLPTVKQHLSMAQSLQNLLSKA